MIGKKSIQVEQHTAPKWNTRLFPEMEDRVRVMQAGASSLALLGLFLDAFASRRWYALSGASLVLLLQHSVQGWSPPMALMRPFGVRTTREVEQEREALTRLLEKR